MRQHSPLAEHSPAHRGHFNSFYVIQTAFGPREVIAHNPDKAGLGAAKMMMLYLPGAYRLQNSQRENTLASVLETIRASGVANWQTLVLAADRPVTYVSDLPVTLVSNNQLEFPGGVADLGEKLADTAVREALEEYGLDGAEDLVQFAPLVDFPMANDAGSNAEIYQGWVALTRKEPHPPRREGIDPGASRLIPLHDIGPHLTNQGRQGVLVEWLAWAMANQLAMELLGGWTAIKQL